ncbi:hypothetical protein LTR86_002855 [Recurvomyces mirabilis]|nr:hypothetical protein LTR86_002855 [Recurvomyces mirabilis]
MAPVKLTAENLRLRQQLYMTPLGGASQMRTKRWVERLPNFETRPPPPPPEPEAVEERVGALLELLWMRWLAGI